MAPRPERGAIIFRGTGGLLDLIVSTYGYRISLTLKTFKKFPSALKYA